MKIVIDIPREDYEYLKLHNTNNLYNAILNGTPLKNWLSSFNTDSATACYTAVQRLKESLNDK